VESVVEELKTIKADIDGIHFDDCHVIVALGVDCGRGKHVLGLREDSSENSRVATDLLRDLVDRGIRRDRLPLPSPP